MQDLYSKNKTQPLTKNFCLKEINIEAASTNDLYFIIFVPCVITVITGSYSTSGAFGDNL